ncbi:MAG: hypothetical protein JSR60_09695 [Proteobacteria bacterium]|nr:hypothetical protein [Pseudomonadota bacterium]
MRAISVLFDAERWEWFAAGDPTLRRPARRAMSSDTAPEHVLWSMGLTLAAPLALAAVIWLVLP